MKKLLLGIFTFFISLTYAQDGIEVTVTGDCEASGGLTWAEFLSGNYAYSGQFNGKDLHIRIFEYQGDQIPLSIRFDNTKWVLQSDQTTEAIFLNNTVSGTFPPLSGWEPAVDLEEEGCTASIFMAVVLSNGELSLEQGLDQIFPNPVSEQFQLVNSSQQNRDYSILDLSGKILKTGRLVQHESIFIGDLSGGNYILKITGEDNTIRNLKLIKD